MTSFLTIIAAPSIRQVSEISVLGKPYVRIGRLFNVIGYWVYQEGGVLGYLLRDSPALLGKLSAPPEIITTNETEIVEYFKGLSDKVASDLEELKDNDKTFFYLYTVRELRNIGIELLRWPPDNNLDKKADTEFAGDVMRISFIKGIALGFNFPEQFTIYWNNTYKVRPDNEWEEMRKRGVVLSEMQQKRTLNDAIVEIAENAISWSTNELPHILNEHDLETLHSIVSNYKLK
jgi:hypothetical protein